MVYALLVAGIFLERSQDWVLEDDASYCFNFTTFFPEFNLFVLLEVLSEGLCRRCLGKPSLGALLCGRWSMLISVEIGDITLSSHGFQHISGGGYSFCVCTVEFLYHRYFCCLAFLAEALTLNTFGAWFGPLTTCKILKLYQVNIYCDKSFY